MDNFGQIDIYNELFKDVDLNTVKGDALKCVEDGTSYCALYNRKELPIMIGSNLDKGRNPLKIKGCFVINGICKTMNNIKFNHKIGYTKNTAFLLDGTRVKIIDMFNYEINIKGRIKKWKIPINYSSILKYSKNKDKLEKHLDIVAKLCGTETAVKEEIDLITLCYMFDCWLGLRDPPPNIWRLLTAGEILKDNIDNDINIVKCFINNTWNIKYIKNVNTVSEDMRHYNIYSDIESIRRISLATSRERAKKEIRMVKIEDKGKICPIQTPDGEICGTVNYLCKDAKITTERIDNLQIEKGDDIHIFINSIYKGKTNNNYINELKNNEFIIHKEKDIIYAFKDYGFIIKSNCELSYTASKMKYIYHNPPIRAMFATSMIKQAIMYDSRKISDLISDVKYLKNNIDFKINVAIMPWYGYNIEDSIVISKSLSEKYSYYKNKVYRSNDVVILDVYVNKGDYVKVGQALYRYFDREEVRSIVTIYAELEGKIELINKNDNSIKIIITKTKNLQVGDKMTSIHGQKGIISLILDDNKMPYCDDTKIELIINPHAFPSRMTMGQIVEMGNNEKIVYVDGKKVENKILVGKCTYYALRHQVDEKLQYRNRGDYDLITKQPTPNGLRFGQMERDILIALEAYNTLTELWSCDLTEINICTKTGIIATKCECYRTVRINQHLVICSSILKCLGYDIKLKDNKYSITEVDLKYIDKTNTIKFGDLDASEVKIFKEIVMLPMCLRNKQINELYMKYAYKNVDIKKNINREVKKLLKSKKGYYHKCFEGHKVDNCIRSVITPDPYLKIDTIKVPKEIKLESEYGLLNRQPSLNINSMKLVKLEYGENKTISFNPLICKLFNADFDGDEMNVYVIKDSKSINELKEKMKIEKQLTQDYILNEDLEKLTMWGITANKRGVKYMIEKGSKGKQFNYDYMYKQIDDIKQNFLNGLSKDNWYQLTLSARENAISIALNTPITGQLQSLSIQSLI